MKSNPPTSMPRLEGPSFHTIGLGTVTGPAQDLPPSTVVYRNVWVSVYHGSFASSSTPAPPPKNVSLTTSAFVVSMACGEGRLASFQVTPPSSVRYANSRLVGV